MSGQTGAEHAHDRIDVSDRQILVADYGERGVTDVEAVDITSTVIARLVEHPNRSW